jgi:hypothetical protein
LTQQSERTGIENKWFTLTGRVVALKVETDGDLHIALQDATGDKPGIVIVEVPEKPLECSIRETVFSWTATGFPFRTSSARKLKLIGALFTYPAHRTFLFGILKVFEGVVCLLPNCL